MNGSTIRPFWPAKCKSAREYGKYGGFALFRYASPVCAGFVGKKPGGKEKKTWRTFCKTRERREAAASRGGGYIYGLFAEQQKNTGDCHWDSAGRITLTVTVVAVVAKRARKGSSR